MPKTIQPVQIWTPQGLKSATSISARIISDDLQSAATFYFELSEDGEQAKQISNGNVSMSGDDYTSWDGSNDAAYAFVAAKINVTIL